MVTYGTVIGIVIFQLIIAMLAVIGAYAQGRRDEHRQGHSNTSSVQLVPLQEQVINLDSKYQERLFGLDQYIQGLLKRIKALEKGIEQ